jgi:hypothetical protein
MVTGPDISTAERVLNLMGGHSPEERAIAAKVDMNGFNQFVNDRWNIVRQRTPDMPSSFKPPMNTMLLHFFLVGVVCGRNDKIEEG